MALLRFTPSLLTSQPTGAAFMGWKLFNTPDVNPTPEKPYHWQQYDAKGEHQVDAAPKK